MKDLEITSLNEEIWSIDVEDVSVEALERRFELALIAMGDVGADCSPICGTFCSPVLCGVNKPPV
jgi:hypothetical protein